jgi:hypothetical protein
MQHKPNPDFRILLAILSLALLVALPLAGCAPAAAAGSTGPVVKVYYAGPAAPGGAAVALQLAAAGGFIQQVSDPAQADVFVFNGAAGGNRLEQLAPGARAHRG